MPNSIWAGWLERDRWNRAGANRHYARRGGCMHGPTRPSLCWVAAGDHPSTFRLRVLALASPATFARMRRRLAGSGHRSDWTIGRMMRKRLPCPTPSLVAVIKPPCFSQMSLAIAKPKPAPERRRSLCVANWA